VVNFSFLKSIDSFTSSRHNGRHRRRRWWRALNWFRIWCSLWRSMTCWSRN
jgi:hypothetical protein